MFLLSISLQFILMPLSKISTFFFFGRFRNFGMSCCTELNKIRRSSVKRKQSSKKCSVDSTRWHRQSGESDNPIVKPCWFRKERPTRSCVCRELPRFEPLEKCLILLGFNFSFNFSLKMERSCSVLIEFSRLFQEILKTVANWTLKSNVVLFENEISKCPIVSEKSWYPIAF